ncbi:unnamed protein product [Tilletia controversa]|nr:unnamed protein product [Tilletia controversa]
MFAFTTSGAEMSIERTSVELRPGDPKDSSYIKSHLGHEPWRVRVFGKVVSSSSTSFTVTGQTFLVTGAGKFTVELVSSNNSPIPRAPAIGEFAGGSGVVQSISKNPPYITVILESVHIGVASQATAAEVPQQPQASAWISALQGEANVEPAAVPPTEDVDGTVEITPVNSFCETTFRFPLFQSEIAPSHWLRVQSKTLT